jgi:hypothetical protein
MLDRFEGMVMLAEKRIKEFDTDEQKKARQLQKELLLWKQRTQVQNEKNDKLRKRLERLN